MVYVIGGMTGQQVEGKLLHLLGPDSVSGELTPLSEGSETPVMAIEVRVNDENRFLGTKEESFIVISNLEENAKIGINVEDYCLTRLRALTDTVSVMRKTIDLTGESKVQEDLNFLYRSLVCMCFNIESVLTETVNGSLVMVKNAADEPFVLAYSDIARCELDYELIPVDFLSLLEMAFSQNAGIMLNMDKRGIPPLILSSKQIATIKPKLDKYHGGKKYTTTEILRFLKE